MDEKVLALFGAGALLLFVWYLARRMRPAQELPGLGEKLSLYAGVFLLSAALFFGIHAHYAGKSDAENTKKLQKFQKESTGCAGSKERLKSFKKDP